MTTRHVPAGACQEFQSSSASRRDLLKAGVVGTLGLGLADLLRLTARAESKNAKRSPVRSVIFLEKYGAPSHIDTWDMKPDAPSEIRGEFAAIPTGVPGYVVCEHMPRMARVVEKMTIVRTMAHTVANHNPATYFM
ncbi:MAG: DUF1501 domain-containing protein, partial [Planctomycetaceae bacterium]